MTPKCRPSFASVCAFSLDESDTVRRKLNKASFGNGGGIFLLHVCGDFFRGDVKRGDEEGGAGRRDQTYQVPAVLIPSEAVD
jgi:hypothetical protein